eukprot:CAMPEP_0172443140 /NCGR_PEP_ID=MMETSP1065-20121228/3445_1 /TAXON_ID=265537 /ORGANISM="Amphiprora paludosa, Strain CCMP125" /LENGTH=142 /DNA_ID=CAMNT_0013193261 /DNA_START=94 /DNA_END=522 /DNA_ORIENTATION=-
MATRGIVQLKKLILNYSEFGGSSRAMRAFLSEGHIIQWAEKHPETQIEVNVRNGRHPYVQGHYETRVTQHQVCVKNLEGPSDIREVCDMLANRSGRKITKIVAPVLTDTPSIQGIWTPFLNLQHETPFEVSIREPPRTIEES